MKKALCIVVVLVALYVGYQEAAAVSISFDGFPATGGTGEIRGNEFEASGIIFSTPDLALNLAPPTTPFNPVNCLGADSAASGAFRGKVVFQFTENRISNDLQFVVLSRFASTPVNAFDINGNIIFTQNVFNNLRGVIMDLRGLPVHKVEVTGGPGCIFGISFTLTELPDDGGSDPPGDGEDDQIIGGKIIPTDQTALFLAGAQLSLVWILPIVLAGAGLAAFKIKRN